MLGTGEAGCHYGEEDAREWIKDVEFAKGTRGVSRKVMGSVVEVLKGAGVVDKSMEIKEGDGVVGIGDDGRGGECTYLLHKNVQKKDKGRKPTGE